MIADVDVDADVARLLSAEDTRRRRIHWLGVFVTGVAVWQLGVTVAAASSSEPLKYLWLDLNPRALWVMLFSGISDVAGAGISMLMALLSLAIGLVLVKRRSSGALFGFLCLEGLVAAPAVFFFGTIWIVNLSPSHGISREEILVPAAVCLVTNLGSWLAALWLWRRAE